MSIPLSKDDVRAFTPQSLENVVPTPVFRFRPPTERDQNKFKHLLTLEGLRLFPEQIVRAETLRVLEENWDEKTYQEQSAHLHILWANMDQDIPIAADEQAWVADIAIKCLECSPFLRQIDADNRRFSEEAPSVALSMYLTGWSNVDAEFRMEAGVVPLDTRLGLQKALTKLEEQALADKVIGVQPGLSFIQLTLHSFQLMALTKEEEKNSQSPSQSSQDPNSSKTSSRRDGASKRGAARSNSRPTKTRQTKSRKSA